MERLAKFLFSNYWFIFVMPMSIIEYGPISRNGMITLQLWLLVWWMEHQKPFSRLYCHLVHQDQSKSIKCLRSSVMTLLYCSTNISSYLKFVFFFCFVSDATLNWVYRYLLLGYFHLFAYWLGLLIVMARITLSAHVSSIRFNYIIFYDWRKDKFLLCKIMKEV